jgi:hypothetical protein
MFKRIKNRLTGKSEPPAPKLQPAKAGQRPQHYMFAHRVLPSLFFRDPALFLNIMSSPKALDMLRTQWDSLGKHFAPVEPSTGLDYETRTLEDNTTIIIVIMPPPCNVTEAYFTAAVYRPPTAGEPALARYFTFEYGTNIMTGENHTVLGEWTADTTHRNYGSKNRTADKGEFIKTVCGILGHPIQD